MLFAKTAESIEQQIDDAASLMDLFLILSEFDLEPDKDLSGLPKSELKSDYKMVMGAVWNLPTFGGDLPEFQHDICSWDADSYLYYDSEDKWCLVSRV